ncbi:MAG: ribosome biogenesis GTPase Der [bacterium]
MKKIKKYPKVLLVGRTNVGKSTLFNRLTEKTKSIVLDTEGVTRDYIHEVIEWDKKSFDLVDTGGVSLQKTTDPILSKIQEKVFDLFKKASVIVFLCDVKHGATEQDKKIAKLLHKNNRPTILAVNKIDNKTAYEENFSEFYSLGFKNIIEISATHGIGTSDLLDEIVKEIPECLEEGEEEKPVYRVAIIGKPNVGKSCLMNLLMQQERSIVSDIAGTTREAISELTYTSENLIRLTDTPGIRRKGRVEETIETLMVKSSLETIRTSDIVILVIDASSLILSHQELKLLDYSYQEKKSIILVLNKMDLLNEDDKKMLKHNLSEYDFLLKKIPTIMVSCQTKKNVHKIYKELEESWVRRIQKFDNIQLDEIIKENLLGKPLYHKGIQLKLFKIRQIKDARVPTFQIFVNYPDWFEESQLGFLENILRRNFNLKGCPVVFVKKEV